MKKEPNQSLEPTSVLGTSAAGHAGRFDFVSTVLFYLGVSLAFHAFPSLQDAKVVDDELWKKETSLIAKIVCAPVVFLFALKAIANFVIVDMIWGLAVGGILPFLWLGVR